jgi:hypothetical protein
VHLVNKHFAFFNSGIGIFQINAAESKRFNFGSQKDHSGFVCIFDKIAVPGFSIFSYNFYMVCAQILFSPNPDKPEPKISATKALSASIHKFDDVFLSGQLAHVS